MTSAGPSGRGDAVGVALLAFDVTEHAFAERNRREFTANVSHELKTPLQSILGSAEKKHVRISVAGEPVQISGAGTFLYEMVYNLCDNAVKYNVENGSVEVTVSGPGQEAVVTVRDTGIGIPPEYQSRIFERFFRVDKSRSKASGGTGLGLSIVKHTVQYHNGTVGLQSEAGKGTVISVTLPGANSPS